MMSDRSFAELLAAALDDAGVSRSRAAELLSINRSTLHRWLAGGRPLPSQRHALARLPAQLGMSPSAEARFLSEVAEALGFALRRPAPGAPSQPVLHHRLHFGSDHLPPFAGRAAELAELRRFVLGRRSVVITGLGGVGKTRLAQELLHVCAADFAHGCEFLTLTSGQSFVQVIRQAARLLGVELQPEELAPDNRRLALDELARRLRGADMLFLVDNVEDAGQVRDLPVVLGSITWVFTTRRAGLSRAGVAPLHLRPPHTEEARAIFRAHLPAAPIPDRGDDYLVGRVVDKLGGLPYALRLAAAVLGNRQASSVAELDEWLAAERLGRGGSPTRKLERFFDAMLDSVPASARRTLLLCGIFGAPTIRIAAVQAVGEAAGARPTPSDWAALEDSSLVEYPDHERVTLHARLHDHVRKRLPGEPYYPAVRQSYAAYYLALAESVSLGIEEPDRDYRPLIPEEQELVSAAEQLYAAGNWEGLRRLWPALSAYLWRTGNRVAYERLDRHCLEAAREQGDESWAAVLLSELGYVKKEAGEWVQAEELFHQSQAVYDALPEAIPQARLRRYRAEMAMGRGDFDGALALLAEAQLRLTRTDDEPPSLRKLAEMLLYSTLMTVHHQRGALGEAEAAGLAAERLYQTVKCYGEFRIELGDILLRRGYVDEAVRFWAETLASRGGLPELPEHAEARLRLAWLAAKRGDHEEALQLAGEARRTMERHGRLARGEAIGRFVSAIEAGEPLPDFAAFLSS